MDTLENTYQWLQVSEHALPQHALAMYIQQMHAAVEKNNPKQALTLLDEVKETAATIADPLVQACVHLQCARANYNLNAQRRSHAGAGRCNRSPAPARRLR